MISNETKIASPEISHADTVWILVNLIINFKV